MKFNIITSYPKSGNTWIRFIIYDLFFNYNSSENTSSFIINKFVPDFHNIYKDNQIIISKELIGKKIFIKSHFSYKQMKKIPIEKVIILIRNPIDVLSSLINYYEYDRNQINDLVIYFSKNHTIPFLKKLNFPSWSEHFKSWEKSETNFLLINYSNLLNDFDNQIIKISNFFEIILSKKKIKFINKNINFDKLKNIEEKEIKENRDGFFLENMKGKKTKFMNKGKNKKYFDTFDKNQINLLNNTFEKYILKYNL